MATNKISRGKYMKQHTSNFTIYVFFPLTNEKFTISDIQLNTRISDIKRRLELTTGVPTTLQRLFYLDKDDLLDNSDLRSNDVVMSAILNLHVWNKWQKIIFNSFIGNPSEILKSDIVCLDKDKEENYRQMINISLFVSANKGKRQLMDSLITEGANVNWTTAMGRTALHAAAAQGQTRCIDLLLESEANADLVDFAGKTPAMVANEYGHRHSEKQLFLFQWQKRADRLTLKKGASNLMMHQQFDSGYRTWLKGATQQVYLCKTLPAGEFIGTQIDAPRCKSTKSDRASSSQQFPRHQTNESKDTADGMRWISYHYTCICIPSSALIYTYLHTCLCIYI